MDKPELPPLPKEVFDGEHYEAPIPKNTPLPKNHTHRDVTLVSSTEVKCSCGVGWTGPDILKLYNALKKQ
mgnify:CR=1 FL=1